MIGLSAIVSIITTSWLILIIILAHRNTIYNSTADTTRHTSYLGDKYSGNTAIWESNIRLCCGLLFLNFPKVCCFLYYVLCFMLRTML